MENSVSGGLSETFSNVFSQKILTLSLGVLYAVFIIKLADVLFSMDDEETYTHSWDNKNTGVFDSGPLDPSKRRERQKRHEEHQDRLNTQRAKRLAFVMALGVGAIVSSFFFGSDHPAFMGGLSLGGLFAVVYISCTQWYHANDKQRMIISGAGLSVVGIFAWMFASSPDLFNQMFPVMTN